MWYGGWRQTYVKSWGLNLPPSLIFRRQIKEAISLIISLQTLTICIPIIRQPAEDGLFSNLNYQV